MKLLTRQILGATVAVALTGAGVLLTVVIWAAVTPQGTRWLLEAAIPLSGVSLSVKKIDGKIIDRLLLTGVRLNMAQQKVEIDTLELRWKPLLLLSGTIAVQELNLGGVRIQDDAPPNNKPPILSWPKASGNAQLFDGSIGRLQVSNLSYRTLQKQPELVTYIGASVTWQDSLLTITDLNGITPSGRINGGVAAGFNKPSLTADLAIALAHPIAAMNHFTLKVRPVNSGPEPFVGTVMFTGSAGSEKLLELGGDIGMAANAVNLRRLNLTRPGRQGLITADGSLAFTALESVLSLQVKVAGLDLAPELNVPTDLSGTLKFAGTLDRYKGNITLANSAKGWQAATVSAAYQGTFAGLKLAPLTATVLDGSLAGNLDIDWRNGFALQGAISGSGLNPARLDPDWKGVANFSATGKMVTAENAPVSGSVSALLLDSILHGQALTGQLQADFAGNDIAVARLALRGKGFDLHASGELKRRLLMTARITDFSRLVPGSTGTLLADGWLRRRNGNFSGALAGAGNKLAYAGTEIAAATMNIRLDEGKDYPLHAAASLQDVVYGGYTVDAMTVAADGTLQQHAVKGTLRSDGAEARLALSAGYNDGTWRGQISRLAGSDDNGAWNLTAPAAFSVSAAKFFLSPLIITAGAAERLEVAANLTLKPLRGQLQAEWADVNLARANSYLHDLQISGSSYGNLRLGFLSEKRLTLTGRAGGNGSVTGEDGNITIEKSLLTFDGNEQGLRIAIELSESSGGRGKGTFSSPAPFRLVIPEAGKLTAELNGFDLALFKPWLPGNTRAEGRLNARAKGSLIPGQRFKLDGNAELSGAALQQINSDGELNVIFTTAAVSWGWSEEMLSGKLSLATTEYGKARGDFQLPVPARFPVAVNPQGALRGSLSMELREKGIIAARFPELIQKSSGDLEADLTVNGTWGVPQIGGKLRLAKGGAYLPTTGIQLKEIGLSAHLEQNLILIDSFRALSGPGYIEGTAVITLAGLQVIDYHGTIRGKNFQSVHLPELRILSSPELTFEGTPQKIILRGDLLLPELHFVGTPSRTAIAPSTDAIVAGRVLPLAKRSPLALDIQVRLLLGEQVFVSVAGIEAQLGGGMDLSLSSFDRITSRGEIKVIKGRYRTYGVNLDIVRGRLFFAGGPIDQPALDFLALRSIGDVRAGVTVAGTIQKPITRLYSEPAMPDVDVLAYVVLGHPLGSNGEQASLVNQAAGALLTSGQASVLQDQIKSHLGLSTLEIQGDVGKTNGSMGYKPLQVTAPGAIPATQQPGITDTVLTVGKYLNPKLYISYGRSLFTGSNLFLLRYDIFKQWQIETQTGDESGVDLFYKLEFK